MRSIQRHPIVFVTLLMFSEVACGTDGNSTGGPTATTTAQPTSQETLATAASTSEPLPESTYRTAELTREQLIATGTAAGFAAADTEAGVGAMQHSEIATIKLESGSWTALVALDGGPDEVVWSGSYEVVDEQTVIATDSCGSITYDYTYTAEQLTLRVVDDQCPGVGELVAQTLLYQTAPFDQVPA